MTETTSDQPTGRHLFSLLVFVVVCFGVAAMGAFFPPDEWYRSLTKPSFAPPDWLFGPVWTVLYLMIAVSGWLVFTCKPSAAKRTALTVFAVQLILNAAWSAIFFGLHQPGWALIEIGVLWAGIVSTILLFRRHSALAAGLLVPYLLWVSFASVLNYGFWSLN